MTPELYSVIITTYIITVVIAIIPATIALVNASEQRQEHKNLTNFQYWWPLVGLALVFTTVPPINTALALKIVYNVVYFILFDVPPYLYFDVLPSLKRWDSQ